jgi:hypothetical protein
MGQLESALARTVKLRKLPSVKRRDDDEPVENYRAAFLLRADAAINLAVFNAPIPITREFVSAARRAAETWSKLAQTMESSL